MRWLDGRLRNFLWGILILFLVVGIIWGIQARKKTSLPLGPKSSLRTFGSLLSEWQLSAEEIRQEVLSSLEKEFELCQIVKDNVSHQGGEFWLLCNGRPFYALYEKGKVNYELNGWSFLKDQPEVLKELQDNNCRLYQATDDHNLGFICEDGNVRKYTFTPADFKLTKSAEEDFLGEILGELWASTVSPCELSDAAKVGWEGDSALRIEMKCQENDAVVFFNLDKLFFTLPVVVDKELSTEEKIRQSVGLLSLSDCNLKEIKPVLPTEIEGKLSEEGVLQSLGQFPFKDYDSEEIRPTENQWFSAELDCPNKGSLTFDYNVDFGNAYFSIAEDDFPSLFPLIGKYNFPFLKSFTIKYLASRQDEAYQNNYYLVENWVIVGQRPKEEEAIDRVYLKTENLE